MRKHFEELFAYNHHFNQAYLQYLPQISHCEKSYRLMNHLINAHQIWLARIVQTAASEVWEMHSWEELQQIHEVNYSNTKKLLRNISLDQRIVYQNSKGDTFENTVQDILFHIINHSTYHRAQIATDIKLQGYEPIATDYIFYKREKK